MKQKITLSKSESKTFKEGYDQFLLEKRAVNVSPDTILFYEMCYKYFTSYLGEDTSIKNITSETVVKYVLYMREQKPNSSDITLNTYIRGVRAILYSFMEKGYLDQFKVSLLRAEKKIKETYTDYELEILLKKPDLKKVNFATYRDWVIICYLLGTGNRARTLCNVKIGDVDLKNHEIKLKKVKNKKQYSYSVLI